MDAKPDIGKRPGVGPANKNLRHTLNWCFLLPGLYCAVLVLYVIVLCKCSIVAAVTEVAVVAVVSVVVGLHRFVIDSCVWCLVGH